MLRFTRKEGIMSAFLSYFSLASYSFNLTCLCVCVRVCVCVCVCDHRVFFRDLLFMLVWLCSSIVSRLHFSAYHQCAGMHLLSCNQERRSCCCYTECFAVSTKLYTLVVFRFDCLCGRAKTYTGF